METEIYNFDVLVCELLQVDSVSANQGLICCFLNRGEKNRMGNLKEVEVGFANIYLLPIGSKRIIKKTCINEKNVTSEKI